MKTVPAIAIFIFTAISFQSSAQGKTFVREYTYKAGEMDSKISCRAIAINELRFELLNEIGVYVESENLLKTTEVGAKYSQDFVEKVTTLTAGVTKLDVLDEKWNGVEFWMKAAITIDKKSLERSLKQLINDRQRVKELENVKEKLVNATKEMEQLKSELTKTKNNAELMLQQNKKYNSEIATLSSSDYFYSGKSKMDKKDFEGASNDFTKAINIDSSRADYFEGKGVCLAVLGDCNSAIKFFTRAIRLNPNNAETYFNRGKCKDIDSLNNNYSEVIADYSKAIEIDSKYWEVYYQRGVTVAQNAEYNNAIIDLTKVIEIVPNNADAYLYRGIARLAMGQNNKACIDLKKALELGQESASEWIKKDCK